MILNTVILTLLSILLHWLPTITLIGVRTLPIIITVGSLYISDVDVVYVLYTFTEHLNKGIHRGGTFTRACLASGTITAAC